MPATKATGNYTSAEYDHVRAYQVLAHAEIESCLEDLAFDVAISAFVKWKNDGRPRPAVLAMVAYHEGSIVIPSILSPSGAPGEVRHRVEKAKNAYTHYVRALNNGVREHNVLSLLLPLGLGLAEIDNTWLATVDSFGQDRGQTAHLSSTKVVQRPDPANERATVTLITTGLGVIDQKLAPFRR